MLALIKSNVFSVFVIALVVSIIIGEIFFTSSEDRSYDHVTPVLSIVHSVSEEESVEETTYEGISILKRSGDAGTYQYTLQIPQFGQDRLDAYFQADAESRLDHFVALLESSGRVSVDHPGAFYLNTNLYLAGSDLFSAVQTVETYTGGANFDQQAHVYLADLLSGTLVDQKELFDDPIGAQDVLLATAEEALRASEYYSDYILDDELDAWVNQESYNFTNLFIKNDQFVIKFDKYEVTAGVAGMPEVEIPIADLEEFINEYWLERIQAGEEEALDDYYL